MTDAQCTPASWERHLEIDVIDGRAALRRPLERALRGAIGELTSCHVRSVRGATPERVARRSEASVTVFPDGHLEARVQLGETQIRDARSAQADREADQRVEACLVRALSRPTIRPRPSRPSELRVLVRYEPVFHPARPCSDPGGLVR
ncbi:MAG: hypothetical protein ACK6CU_00645 [Deltaproteobacteria bacterium]